MKDISKTAAEVVEKIFTILDAEDSGEVISLIETALREAHKVSIQEVLDKYMEPMGRTLMNQARMAERERCAKIAEINDGRTPESCCDNEALNIAQAIRAQPTEK